MQHGSARLVVIGAGPAGLATAGVARRMGVEPLIFDAGEQVGGAWVKMRPSMRCLSPRRFDRMPDGSVPGAVGESADARVTAAQVVAWLSEYAERERFDLRLNTQVTALRRADRELAAKDGALAVTTAAGEWRAERCVVATGEFGRPKIPRVSGTFDGSQVHSSAFDPASFGADSTVVVVGARNSAAEVVPLLVQRGAKVTIACRKGEVSRGVGVATGWRAELMWRLSALPLRRVPRDGGCTVSTPAVDSTLHTLAARGAVEVVGEVVGLQTGGVVTKTPTGGTAMVACDAIVWATGFARDVQWLPAAIGRSADGVPRHREGVSTDWPELGFVGIACQRTRRSGFIRGFTGDARHVLERLL